MLFRMNSRMLLNYRQFYLSSRMISFYSGSGKGGALIEDSSCSLSLMSWHSFSGRGSGYNWKCPSSCSCRSSILVSLRKGDWASRRGVMKGLLVELKPILAENSAKGVEGCPEVFFMYSTKIKNELNARMCIIQQFKHTYSFSLLTQKIDHFYEWRAFDWLL